MNRLIVVIVLNDAHSSASNWKFPIVRPDSLSCSPYPCQDVFRPECRVFQANVDLNLSSSYVQEISWGLCFDLRDRRGDG
jgi:hypothetical protein